MEFLKLAEQITKKAFDEKVDKAGQPYYNHLIRVASNVPDYGQTEGHALKTIAVLHDLLEDCPEWNEKALRTLFPDVIVNRVVLLTHRKEQSYDDYIKQIKEDGWATEVKLADLRDNMDLTRLPEITDKDVTRLRKYLKAYRFLMGFS